MRIIITGADGQLGHDLKRTLKGHDLFAFTKDDLDIGDLPTVIRKFEETAPDAAVNCAAYTDVDGCESNIDHAYRVNAGGPQNLAIACERVGADLLQVSTDFIFDGKKDSPYVEFDRPDPLSIYGSSKLAGEKYVSSLTNRYYIVRTAWLYGHNGNNFVKSIIRIAKEKEKLQIVNDQIGTPTFTFDLAERITDIIESRSYGIYHVVNGGQCSWYDFGKKILDLAGLERKVEPISSKDLDRPATRPEYSVLDDRSLRTRGFSPLRSWESGLAAYFEGS